MGNTLKNYFLSSMYGDQAKINTDRKTVMLKIVINEESTSTFLKVHEFQYSQDIILLLITSIFSFIFNFSIYSVGLVC